jgi:hypothetical protein
MNRNKIAGALASVALLTGGAGALTGVASAAPLSKQNGNASINPFVSVCSLTSDKSTDGRDLSNYGECGGDTTKFTDITSKIDVVQAKAGRYNYGFTFGNLTPGEEYTLIVFVNGSVFARLDGSADAVDSLTPGVAKYGWQYTPNTGDKIAFDLNHNYGTTTVTSFWNGATLTDGGQDGMIAG